MLRTKGGASALLHRAQTRALQGLRIGIPQESALNETRVALIPTHAQQLVKRGAVVRVMANAGAKSGFSNEEYQAAGAEICHNIEDLAKQTDLFLKVNPPTLQEAKMVNEGKVLISAIRPFENKQLLVRRNQQYRQ